MKQAVLFVAFFGFAACGRLDGSQYLPPNQQQRYQGAGASSNQYQGGAASGTYSASGNQQYQGGANQYQKSPNQEIPILRLENNNEGDGNYQYAFETGNGIQAQQQGSAQDDIGTQSQGSYSYTSPEGEQIQISYQADANGFQPQGSHIPTPPPVPEEILKAIEQNLADEAKGIVDDGQYRPEHEGPNDHQQQGGYQQNQQKNQYQGAQNNQYIPPNQRQQSGYKY